MCKAIRLDQLTANTRNSYLHAPHEGASARMRLHGTVPVLFPNEFCTVRQSLSGFLGRGCSFSFDVPLFYVVQGALALVFLT